MLDHQSATVAHASPSPHKDSPHTRKQVQRWCSKSASGNVLTVSLTPAITVWNFVDADLKCLWQKLSIEEGWRFGSLGEKKVYGILQRNSIWRLHIKENTDTVWYNHVALGSVNPVES